MFRTHFVFVEESRFLHRPKGDPTTNFEYCHLSTRVSERTVPMYAEPQTLVNMSGWHTSLTCSVLEEVCEAAQWVVKALLNLWRIDRLLMCS